MRAKPRKQTDSYDLDPYGDAELLAMERSKKRQQMIRMKELNFKKNLMAIEKETLKEEQELLKLKDTSPSAETGKAMDSFIATLMTNPEYQKQWLSYDDAQRAILLSTVQASKTPSAGMNAYAPLMFSMMNRNPTSSVDDLLKLVSTVNQLSQRPDNTVEMLKVVLPLMQQQRSQDTSAANVMKETIGLLKELGVNVKDDQFRQDYIQLLKDQSSTLPDQIAGFKQIADVMGFSPRGNDLEITKMQLDMDRWKTEQSWNMQKAMMDMEMKKMADQQQNELFAKLMEQTLPALTVLLNTVTSAGAAKIQQFGNPTPPTSVAPQPYPPHQPQDDPLPATEFLCPNCGEPNPLTPKGEYPGEFTCIHCQKHYESKNDDSSVS